ncbi:acyl-coenzyme A thioesterase 8 [Misgurnus anguillicaudatus]|uniref:acyl-coenzyme A thioesterase 8 n=1 Tax=Misgurnus anguillicaudatus TaxID=75329 RepID=UPI002434E09D|nr:acyl-coenzyme A thioesterase 8 [Misgurnus anguillicaudatus]
MADSSKPAQTEVDHKSSPGKADLRSVLVTSVLNLDRLDTDLYRGTHHWIPRTKRLFGGQIIGQALVAAAKSVSENVYAHSLHCYFVRAGDPSVPVLYQVERTRDGRSFCVRSVKAIQHGQPILICQASFHMRQPSPLEHQFIMPTVPPPDALLTIEELIQRYLSDPNLADTARQGLNKILADEVPIEIKPINPPDFYRRTAMEPKKLFWVRARGHIGNGDMKLHCCVAAYVSDYFLLGTALLPYPNYRAQFSASLDHAMWFHSTFRADEWMLYECESPWAGGSRGFIQGRMWRQDGVLAASCAQEGVLRVKEMSQSKL